MTLSSAVKLLCVIATAVLISAALLMRAQSPQARDHWQYEVFTTGLSKVDNIVIADDRSLFVSLELPDGKGQVMQLKQGNRTVILDRLRRPDGLTLSSNLLFVTEEVERGRIIRLDLDSRHAELIARLDKPEGIRLLPGGNLVVTEDLATDGRLVTITMSGRITPLAGGLSKPEGVAVGRDGTVYVAESGMGRILGISAEGRRTVVAGLNSPDQVAIASDGALWITEDRVSGRVMRYLDGKLETVLSGVNKPQGIAIDDAGWVYIAEQGRDRILRLRHVS